MSRNSKEYHDLISIIKDDEFTFRSSKGEEILQKIKSRISATDLVNAISNDENWTVVADRD